MKRVVRLGVIGSNFGVIGLLPAFDSIDSCEVVAICARNSEELGSYLKESNLKSIYTDWRLLLKNEKLDAVALAVTPNAQYQIAKAAIEKGLSVFAEKPLAANLTQARELLDLAKKKKITHGIDFMFPEIAEWEKVKELIDRKTLGDLKHLSVNWDWLSSDIKYKKSTWRTSVESGGGALAFYFSHGLNYLEYFAGRISHMRSLFTYSSRSLNGGEVGIDILLKFKSGTTGYAHVSCVSSGMVRHQLIFQCEDGVIVLENKNAVVNNFSVRIYSAKGIEHPKVIKNRNIMNEDERVKIIRKLASRFIRACIENKQTRPSFKDGERVHELIEEVRSGSEW